MDFKKSFEKFFSKKSIAKYIVMIGFIGILFILISGLLPQKSETKNSVAVSNAATTTEEYTILLEQKINNIVSQIDGVGNSEVVITLENGVENVYANSNRKTSDSNESSKGQSAKRSDTQQDVVIVDGSGGKQALMVTQKEPTVKGVVVVCEGADNSLVVKRVTDAVTTSLNIKTNRVSIVKGMTTKK